LLVGGPLDAGQEGVATYTDVLVQAKRGRRCLSPQQDVAPLAFLPPQATSAFPTSPCFIYLSRKPKKERRIKPPLPVATPTDPLPAGLNGDEQALALFV